MVAESTRLLRRRVRRSLINHAARVLGLELFLFVAINDKLVQFRDEKPQEDDVTMMLAVDCLKKVEADPDKFFSASATPHAETGNHHH